MSENIFYLNGKFLPESKAKISVLDLGLVRGYGVFDFLRTYHGKPFKLNEHLKRLIKSAKSIDLDTPWSLNELKKIIIDTLNKNKLLEANIKIIVTGGISPDQITPAGHPSLAVLVYPPAKYPSHYYTHGVKVITVSMERFLPDSKTVNYIPAVLALIQAKKEKAVEALYLNRKKEVLEGTTTNFFIFKKNVLITPKNNILLGITRDVVLALAKKEFKIETRAIKYQELKEVDETFITASHKEIMPVVKVDDIIIGNGRVGKNTKKIMELFREYTEKY